MNYLEFYDTTVETRKQQGWARIMVTHGGDPHPYVGNLVAGQLISLATSTASLIRPPT